MHNHDTNCASYISGKPYNPSTQADGLRIHILTNKSDTDRLMATCVGIVADMSSLCGTVPCGALSATPARTTRTLQSMPDHERVQTFRFRIGEDRAIKKVL